MFLFSRGRWVRWGGGEGGEMYNEENFRLGRKDLVLFEFFINCVNLMELIFFGSFSFYCCFFFRVVVEEYVGEI